MNLAQKIFRGSILFVIGLFLLSVSNEGSESSVKYDAALFKTMKWRCIGPYRGGRVTAVAGVPDQPLVYYFGATGGGVWKTEDAGLTWEPISDEYFKTGSVGAIAVAESDPNIIYVGMGECSLRNDISHGDGIYKSEDGGKSWKHLGLDDSRHIGRIRIHPENPDLVYAAVLGHVYGENKERGIFRSKDGGQTWEKVLYIDEKTGAVDFAIDSKKPDILYAGMWQVKMTPWGIYSCGSGSGLYRSTNGGNTWVELTNGLPQGLKGRIGVCVSPVNSKRVWALIEAEDGGLFRSDDGGQSWRLMNNESPLRVRHYYYTHIFADTQDPDKVYVLTTPFLKSEDGGKTFRSIPQPLHRDNHDLWIDPEDNLRMINGNDGGATISFNGGKSWSRLDNQPTAQMYHVTIDNQFPYRVYGAQQDNTTISVPSRMSGKYVVPDMHPIAGGESGYIAVHPEDPDITFGGSMWGRLTRHDLHTNEVRDISIWPDKPMGRTGAEVKYRFNWTFPILISPHDQDTIYAAANVLFKSTNEGQSWDVISPDLTRNDKSKEQHGTLTQIYCTIFAVAESPKQKDLIWAGSDDGLVHITSDGGKNWQNVTPENMPEWSRISIIEASCHDASTAYLAVNRFDLDDYRPYIYRTNDLGKTWKLSTKGIPEGAFVRVVREDPKKKGLLYAGTETGVYVSFDAGESWQSLQLNLPVVPVHDMVVKENDLVVATHGRSFWILDDLTLLHQLSEKVELSEAFLYKPRDTYRMSPMGRYRGGPIGQNPPKGIIVHYNFKEKPEEEVKLEFLDAQGNVIKTFKGKGGEKGQIPVEKGMNSFEWDMRYPDARDVRGGSLTLLFSGNIRGPFAVPGTYQVRLTVGDKTLTEFFQIKKDLRLSTTPEEFQKQFDLLIKIRDKISDTHDAVNQVLEVHDAIEAAKKRAKGKKNEEIILSEAERLNEKLAFVLNNLVATKVRESEDLKFEIFSDLAYDHYAPFTYFAPILKLNSQFANIQSAVASTDRKPTDQCYENFKELSANLDIQLKLLHKIMEKDLALFNKLIEGQENKR